MDILQILISDSFWAAAIRIATPLIFGVLGALICEKAGVLNLGIEGIFVVGAMAGWLAVWVGAGLWGGLIVAALAGGFFGLIHAILTVPLGLSQHVSGLGVTMFATSVSYFAYRTALPAMSSPPRIEPFRALDIPILSDLPFLGTALFQQTAMTWLAFFLVGLVWWVFNRTPLGMVIRAVGDNPDAGRCAGVVGLCDPHGGHRCRVGNHGAGRRVFDHVGV
jgi:simple sugar transport system permease protein